jgi:D-alanyl-D-alanine carboxypeptidase
MNFYIAFSIHGTKSFKVATLHVVGTADAALARLGPEFKVATSRRPSYDVKKDGIKLHWSRLMRKDGTPLQDKGWVTKRFNQLKAQGWKIVKAKPHTC